MERPQITTLLAALAAIKVDGFTIKVGTLRHSEDSAKATIEFRLEGAKSEEEKCLELIHPELVGKTFECRGSTYTVFGYKPTSPKFPFIGVRSSDGSKFKFTEDAVIAKTRVRLMDIGMDPVLSGKSLLEEN